MVAKLSALLVGYHAPTVRAPDFWYTRKRELVPRSTSPGFNTWMFQPSATSLSDIGIPWQVRRGATCEGIKVLLGFLHHLFDL
jgi:hypothetical protein